MESKNFIAIIPVTTIHPQNSFHLMKLETLYLLNNNSPFSLLLASANHHSTFCLYEFDHCWHHICNRVLCRTERPGCVHITIDIKIETQRGIAYTIMEAEKSWRSSVGSWRLESWWCSFCMKARRLTTQEKLVLHLEFERKILMSQLKESNGKNSLLITGGSLPFCSVSNLQLMIGEGHPH